MKQRFTKRTRLVSALLTLAMVFTFLPFSAFAAGGVTDDSTIELSEQNFPDKAFREYLKQFDSIKKDNMLQPAERKAVKEIKLDNKNIETLEGIQLFPNLETLYCGYNQLKELNVSKNTELRELYCYHNKLTSLDVSQNIKLVKLSCVGNDLTSLDVSQNTNLESLNCANNKLTSLDVSQNTQLIKLDCHGNDLISLDVSKNTNLESLNCAYNNLAGLDVRKNTNLVGIECAGNDLTSLDVSQNQQLKSLWCEENNLVELDVSQNLQLVRLSCYKNQLTSLDVDNTNIDPTAYASVFSAKGNPYPIAVGSDRTFDLSTLPGKFDVTKASNWVDGTVSGSTLKVNEGVNQVTYTYDCGKGCNTTFTLNVNGGGTTIPPEAGKYQLTVTDGVATVTDGSTGHVLNVKPGDTVTLTADTTKFPENEEFGWWEITPYGSVSNTLTGQYQRTATFTMPNENVSARAMSKSAGVSTGGDDGGGGGGAAILLVGGAAVAGLVGYGVYSYVSEQQLKALLPEGVAMPENRAQTALLLWNTAGRPEPSEAPAFKDVADPDTAKAAQWCVEHGLMDQKLGGRFAPDNSDPAYKTLNAYQQLVG